LILLMALLIGVASAPAFARGGGLGDKGHGRYVSRPHIGGHHFSRPRIGFGIIVGAPAFWYYAPPPYYPPLVVVPSAPPVYIERSAPSAPDPAAGYWYYCADTQAYYPYVKECRGTWQRVAPQAPQGQ